MLVIATLAAMPLSCEISISSIFPYSPKHCVTLLCTAQEPGEACQGAGEDVVAWQSRSLHPCFGLGRIKFLTQ